MAQFGDINLMRTRPGVSPQVLFLEQRLRSISLTLVVVVLVVGLIVSFTYLLLRSRYERLRQSKQQLTAEITANATKEGLFTVIKDRISTVQKATKAQRSWAAVLAAIGTIATPPQLETIATEETGRVRIVVKAKSIEDSLALAHTVIDLVTKGMFKAPELTAYQFAKDGTIELSFSFVPVF